MKMQYFGLRCLKAMSRIHCGLSGKRRSLTGENTRSHFSFPLFELQCPAWDSHRIVNFTRVKGK